VFVVVLAWAPVAASGADEPAFFAPVEHEVRQKAAAAVADSTAVWNKNRFMARNSRQHLFSWNDGQGKTV
jgi:hypothetical protein